MGTQRAQVKEEAGEVRIELRAKEHLRQAQVEKGTSGYRPCKREHDNFQGKQKVEDGILQ